MGRVLLRAAWLAAFVVPTALAAQDPGSRPPGPWWLEALYFIVALPLTLVLIFLEYWYILPAPMAAVWISHRSFQEWKRQRFWTPPVVHVLAVLGLATIIAINVDWVMAGGTMWTQRYVVIAIFGIFPYLAYLVFRGPMLIGRKRAPVRDGSDEPVSASDEGSATLSGSSVPGSLPSRAPSPEPTGNAGFGLPLRAIGLASVALIGSFFAAGTSRATSVTRPELEVLHTPEQVAPAARGVTRGDPDAPFTIFVFGDYQCPACARFAERVQPRLDSAFVDTGRARVVFFDLPLVSLHDNAFIAARSAHCAEDQDRFWAYQDELYWHQEEWSSMTTPHDALEDAASAIGLDRAAFRTCLDSDRHTDVVEANRELARSFGINATPTIVISSGDGAPREVDRKAFEPIARTLEEMEEARGS